MSHKNERTSDLELFRELVREIEVAMLGTVTADGRLRSRPMGTVLDEEEKVVWLFLSRATPTAAEVARSPQVVLSFSDPERDRYLSLSGEARFVTDADRIRALWRDEFARWLPGGPDTPGIALVRVAITQAEFWDDSAKLMRNFFETIAAPFSGIPPEAVGEHRKVIVR